MVRKSSLTSFATLVSLLALLSLLGLGLTGCSTSDGADSSEATVASTLPTLDSLADGWTRIEPGEDTVCSDGSEYSFFVRPGDRSKLLFYLQGGGGCWTGETCSSDRFGSFRATVGDTDPASGSGIFELENPENPFADYSMVYVPYCTGDVHLGDRETTYEVAAVEDPSELEEGKNPDAHQVTIQHRGHDNAIAVLDWVTDNFEAPSEIFVTGSSAGSIPSPYYAAHLKGRYQDARVAQLGDGSGGYRREAGGPTPYEPWGTLEAIDAEPAFQSLDETSFDYEALYITAAKAYPSALFASYDTAEDATQLRFLNLGGTPAETLQPLLDANLDEIRTSAENFRSYVAGGDLHVILPRPEFYTYATNGVRVRDWVASLAAGEPVEHVHCEDCSEPEVVPMAGVATTGN